MRIYNDYKSEPVKIVLSPHWQRGFEPRLDTYRQAHIVVDIKLELHETPRLGLRKIQSTTQYIR